MANNHAKDIWQQKCDLVYQHVFDQYQGAGRSVYEDVARWVSALSCLAKRRS